MTKPVTPIVKTPYEEAVHQALAHLEAEIPNIARYSRFEGRGARAFSDDLIYSLAHGYPRPQLKTQTRHHRRWLDGWNRAYAYTYPILGDLEP